MAMFEVDAGHPVPVQPTPRTPDDSPAEITRTDTELLANALGEAIFPIAHAQHRDDPYLTALDARGALVVIEILQALNKTTLVHALCKAGKQRRLSRAGVAQLYAAGPDQFAADFSQFRRSLATTGFLEPTPDATRLIILCSSSDLETLDALEFLQQAGPRIEVKRIGDIKSASNALEAHEQSAQSQEPQLHAADIANAAAAQSSEPAGLRVSSPFSAPIPVDRSLAAATPAASRPGGFRARTSSAIGAPTETGPSMHAAAHFGPRLRPRVVKEESIDTNEIDLGKIRNAQSGTMFAAAMAYGDPSEVLAAEVLPAVPSQGLRAAEAESEPGTADSDPEHAAAEPAQGPRDERLAAIAAESTVPSALVWVRLRRGERFEATLDLDGTITLADGSRYVDPDAAAAAAVGSTGNVNGWRAWRMGENGPTLSELDAQLTASRMPQSTE